MIAGLREMGAYAQVNPGRKKTLTSVDRHPSSGEHTLNRGPKKTLVTVFQMSTASSMSSVSEAISV